MSTLENLSNTSNEQLISALQNLDTTEQVRQEIYRRIGSNVATKLAVRFLCDANEGDREHALNGLIGLCWKAKGNLSILPTHSESRQSQTEHSLTHEFIEDCVLEELAAHKGKPEDEVFRAALDDEFRHIGNRVRSRLISEIRKRSAAKNLEPNNVSLESVPRTNRTELANNLPTSDWDSTLSPATTPQFKNISTPLELIQARKDSLSTSLGKKNYEALEAITEQFPQAFEGTDQQTKSAVTRAIADKRDVSEQSARENKRDLAAKASEEMKRGNRDLDDLHRRLAHSEDDNTFREEFISQNGRRKRSVQFRVEFSKKKSR